MSGFFAACIGICFSIIGMIFDLRYRIYNSQVATLKEVKQVQLQILELQSSLLQKDRES